MTWEQQARLTRAELAAARRDRKKTSFLVDESVDLEVAFRLRREGFTANHVSDVGLKGHSDEDVFAYGWREDRIILTCDTDFLHNRRFPPQRNPGVVVLPLAPDGQRTLSLAVGWVAHIVGHSRELWRRTKITISREGVWVVATFE